MRVHVAAFALFGGCLLGASAAGAVPKPPPPTVTGVRSAPPPAWIETRRSDRWLEFSSYCWTTACADFQPPAQRTDLPRIKVARGEVVRFHLRFTPSQLTLRIGFRTYPLTARRVASWRVRGGSGIVELIARTSSRLRAEYVARIQVCRPASR
jgi:hypothetical protein